ncbi:MAG: hypothetical protein OSA81_05480 [Longimicrobiales bacterium]|nr:hypothetical protein [Longimicrobiales bacterium]
MSERARQMVASVGKAARSVDLSAMDVEAVRRVHDLAMQARVGLLADDHHPAYLHPGRTALILLQDVVSVNVSVVILGLLHESTDLKLRPAATQIADALGGEVSVSVLTAIPRPGDERLVERLVALGPGSALAVLAERLDHLRHLHMRPDLIDTWADTHAEVTSAWLPFAQRTHRKLAVRYAHWSRTFVKRI